jgi:hypothetical protein
LTASRAVGIFYAAAIVMIEHHPTRVLLALMRRRWDEAQELTRQQPIDAKEFVQLCVKSDVHPTVHALLVAHKHAALLGDEAPTRLAQLRAKVRQDNILLLARAEQALEILRRANVTPLALKGLDLLHRVYESFDERTIDDVDLLVAPGDLRRSVDALEEAGWQAPPEPQRTHYIRSSHHLPMRSPGPVPVEFEIHWNLVQEERFGVDPAAILARGVPLEVGGHPVTRMEDHDLVAHLLLHHFTHYFDRRLKWLEDLRRVVALPGFEWSNVMERIRSWNATVASGFAAAHLHKLDPEVVPAEVADELGLSAWRRALVWPLRSSHPLELFRGTQRRGVQLYLAAAMLERQFQLPAWLIHRTLRDRRPGSSPLERDGETIRPTKENS